MFSSDVFAFEIAALFFYIFIFVLISVYYVYLPEHFNDPYSENVHSASDKTSILFIGETIILSRVIYRPGTRACNECLFKM